ncbi:hypothetical protein Fraau_2003 [Frateuria aurantia DSM 6220]|uniref:Uncharacterized protein n=1 Tax=Frateuria aurantia (strain ATCC 33424 / DSM 6220 / KCTC 2777 / LMG 1558 / NBRC 3245 / NCIMB 13370) TaxID=767434 RepID=H8L1X4_FRAAD|nr:hypothetical protein Fraau_2003 [Frateuria aurantia DSM 6220]
MPVLVLDATPRTVAAPPVGPPAFRRADRSGRTDPQPMDPRGRENAWLSQEYPRFARPGQVAQKLALKATLTKS